jgi:uracil-DNA glycosylase
VLRLIDAGVKAPSSWLETIVEGYIPPAGWEAALGPVLATDKSAGLAAFLRAEEEAGKHIYPPQPLRFRALELTPLPRVKAVILGQDPYLRAGQAQGLAFSVPRGVKVPPSLVNVQKELESDLGIQRAGHGNLAGWAAQGVLLLNDLLTVEEGKPGSHKRRGWEEITDAVIAAVAARQESCAFLLWGGPAGKKAQRVPGLLEGGRHLILTAPHPSPLSAYTGFFGCRHFSQTNAFLEARGRRAIDWLT